MSMHAVSFGYGPLVGYTPTYTGFSAAPSGSVLYQVMGQVMLLSHHPSDGTSNGTGFTLTLPSGWTFANTYHSVSARCINSGAASATPGLLESTFGNNAITIYRDALGGAWTASGAKNATFCIIIPVNRS